jgi:hypothetical protein
MAGKPDVGCRVPSWKGGVGDAEALDLVVNRAGEPRVRGL